MAETETVFMNWSGGKDSSLALYELQKRGAKVSTLLTTISMPQKRITMHGVGEELLAKQAEAIGLPLQKVYLDAADMESYNRVMREAMDKRIEAGDRKAVFGDIFLEDLRKYREEQIRKAGLEADFPLWHRDTAELAREFVDVGFKSICVCIDLSVLDASFCGREMDASFFADLPKEVDPCGENGEFHSFVYDGPIFNKPVEVEKGKQIEKSYPDPTNEGQEKRFLFCDLITKK
jgi:uncharacterized protein (TIGR00290 family)